MELIDCKNLLQEERLRRIFAYSQYSPSDLETEENKEQLARRVAQLQADPDVFAYACLCSGEAAGVIVLQRAPGCPDCYDMVGIAVQPAFRGHGMGAQLVEHAAVSLGAKEFRAETDDGAVGFYRCHGFDVTSLGEKYPGVIRYLCTLRLV